MAVWLRMHRHACGLLRADVQVLAPYLPLHATFPHFLWNLNWYRLMRCAMLNALRLRQTVGATAAAATRSSCLQNCATRAASLQMWSQHWLQRLMLHLITASGGLRGS